MQDPDFPTCIVTPGDINEFVLITWWLFDSLGKAFIAKERKKKVFFNAWLLLFQPEAMAGYLSIGLAVAIISRVPEHCGTNIQNMPINFFFILEFVCMNVCM